METRVTYRNANDKVKVSNLVLIADLNNIKDSQVLESLNKAFNSDESEIIIKSSNVCDMYRFNKNHI